MLPLLLALTFTTNFPLAAPPRVDGLLVSPGDPNVVYEVAHGTLYRSTDGGATFAVRSIVNSYLAIDPVDPNLLYDAGQGFVRRSEDGGATWTTHNAGFPNFTPTPTSLAVTPKRTLFISSTCYRDHTGGGVFSSDDRAQTWSGNLAAPDRCVGGVGVDPLTETIYPIYQYEIIPSTGTFPGLIVGSPREPDLRYALALLVHAINDSEIVVLVSRDAARSWQRVAVDGNPRDLALDEESGRLFLTTSTGLFFSDDRTASWQRVAGAPGDAGSITIARPFLYLHAASGTFRAPLANLGAFTPLGPLPADQQKVIGLAVDPTRNGVVYAVGAGIWRSVDDGEHWQSIGLGDKTLREQLAVDGAGDLYALSTVSGAVTLWHYAAASGDWEALPLDFGVSRLAASPLRRGVLYAAGLDGLFVSNDGGRGWQKAASISVYDIAADRSDVVYAGGPSGLFVSTDGGASWRQVDAVKTFHVVVAPSHPSTLYRIVPSAVSPYLAPDVQRSDDGGTTWRRLTYAPYGRALAVDPLDENSVWLDALEHSIDGGKTWRSELGGFDERFIGGYVIDRDGTRLHLFLNPLYANGEFDAVLRVEHHRRAARH